MVINNLVASFETAGVIVDNSYNARSRNFVYQNRLVVKFLYLLYKFNGWAP